MADLQVSCTQCSLGLRAEGRVYDTFIRQVEIPRMEIPLCRRTKRKSGDPRKLPTLAYPTRRHIAAFSLFAHDLSVTYYLISHLQDSLRRICR